MNRLSIGGAINWREGRDRMATAKKSPKGTKKSAAVPNKAVKRKPARKRATASAKKKVATSLGSRIAKALVPAQNAAGRTAKDLKKAIKKRIPAAKKAFANARKKLGPMRKVERAARSAAEQIPPARRAASKMMKAAADSIARQIPGAERAVRKAGRDAAQKMEPARKAAAEAMRGLVAKLMPPGSPKK